MYIVLLGPPGAGKGTQAQIIAEEFNLVHVSSGNLFRENIKNQTALGKKVQEILEKGDLVPDDITIAMVEERLQRDDCKTGALLDGFPRTPSQAEALEGILNKMGSKVDFVPYISVPAEVLVKRLSGRWTCPLCSTVYHETHNPPMVSGKCDHDGEDLIQREDDKPETVKNRIDVYMEQTSPLIKYYRKKNLLIEVDGTRSIEDVSKDLLTLLR